jgi:hypothetical protein
VQPGAEVCSNGLDDDNDGLVDCADTDCAAFHNCQTSHACPSTPDCADPACASATSCIALRCTATADFGTLQPTGSSTTLALNTTGTTDTAVTVCAPGGAGMVVAKLSLLGASDLRLSFTQSAGADHVFALSRAGSTQGCGANPVLDACFDPVGAAAGSHTWPRLAAGNYYLIAQPHEAGAGGSLSVTLTTPTGPEICDNGIDDNADQLIDCEDLSCAADPTCVSQICSPDSVLGALVVDGRKIAINTDTRSASPDNTATCVTSPGGGDVVLSFTLAERAGVLLTWNETGQHVVELTRLSAAAARCDAEPLGCVTTPGRAPDETWWSGLEAGTYALIVKATQPGAEGVMTGQLQAFRAGGGERCHDGVDDDCNGLVDCADPACSIDPGCVKPPVCSPVLGCGAVPCVASLDMGMLAVGGSQHATLDVSGQGLFGGAAACAEPGGKSVVAELRLTEPGALKVDCTQTGDHVLDLHQIVDPRAACDALEVTCVRPTTFPLGCGYLIPNLQPGRYVIVAQAFRAGDEGSIDLTVSEVADAVGEICDNGIDDDGDGLPDCEDPNCIGAGVCVTTQCVPAATIEPVPLTETGAQALLTTTGSGTHGAVPCATTPGGASAVLEVSVTAPADLTVSMQQLGNHAIAIYQALAPNAPCDMGQLLGCMPAVGANQASQQTLANVPVGHYRMIVAGDQPDGPTRFSGSVLVNVSGVLHP